MRADQGEKKFMRMPTPFDEFHDAQRVDQHYAEHYAEIEAGIETLFRMDSTLLDDLLGDTDQVLDATCGTGRHLVPLVRRGLSVTGNDYNPHMITQVRRALAAHGRTATLTEADLVTGLPFADN